MQAQAAAMAQQAHAQAAVMAQHAEHAQAMQGPQPTAAAMPPQ
jgi:hypothetical protein